MTPKEQAVDAAMRSLFGSCPIRVALDQLWDVAYREGDLDRQRFARNTVKPSRRRSPQETKR
jgi:hypothetical protein